MPASASSSSTARTAGMPPVSAQSSAQASAASSQVAPARVPAATAPPLTDARKAHREYEKGLRDERAGNWEAAFTAYSAAVSALPTDRTMQLRQQLARSEIVRRRTEQAERDLVNGETNSARENLQAAVRLDPSYTVARERLQQISAASSLARPAAAAPAMPSERITGPLQVAAAPGTRNFDYRGTTRGAYEEVARQFGLTASFDTDLMDRQIRFLITGADFETAMRVLTEQTGTFWRPIDARSIFVTADTAEKRRQYEPEVKQTIVLASSETNDEMTETSRMIREIVGVRRTDLDLRSHTLTLRDTKENVALAQALIKEVEQARGELLLDIDVLEVNRTAARNLGITPPTTAQAFTFSSQQIRELQQAPNLGTLQQILQSVFGAQNPLAAVGGAAALVPPLIAFGGGKTIFFANLPGAMAQLSQSFSVVRRAQRVLLRIEDGRPATFFVGQHYPITLALLSESLIAPATQFTNAVAPGAFPRTDYGTGASPAGVALGEFNGDVPLDLAIANQTANTVSILLGKGDGTFGPRTDFATGSSPVAVVAQDFNKDGKQDLAVINKADSTVSILLGNGDGTFGTTTTFATGTGPTAMVAADLNKDGNVDLAIVNQTANTVSILLGKGDGTFSPKQDLAVGQGPSNIVFGDFDNDGEVDLAVTNHTSNTFSILLGRGDGTFPTRTDFVTGAGPSAIASADFNADGRLDLTVANQTDNTVSLFLGNGDGTFNVPATFATENAPAALLAADFNLDNIPDLVVANQGSNDVSIFLGLGDGTFVPPIPLATGNTPVALAEGDLLNTQVPDLLVVNQGSNTVSAILNTSTISVTPNAPLTAYPASEYVDIGLKVHAVPRLHPNNEVTLDLQFDISSISGQNVNGIPIITNRAVNQSVRLRDNQTSVLAGMIESSEVRSVLGLPGLSQAGPAGYLFGAHSKNQSETELLIAITPRQLRLAPRTNRSIYAGRGTGSAPAQAENPLPPQPLPPGTAPAQAPANAAPPNRPQANPQQPNQQPNAQPNGQPNGQPNQQPNAQPDRPQPPVFLPPGTQNPVQP